MKVALVMACFVLMAGMVACHRPVETQNAEDVQRLIQAQIDLGVEATRTKDIDRYMSVVPEDWVLHDEEGHTVTRDDLRRGALEQWAIIEKTTSISVHVDRLALHGNEATVWTSQRWERLMHERTGPALDDVLTTQVRGREKDISSGAKARLFLRFIVGAKAPTPRPQFMR